VHAAAAADRGVALPLRALALRLLPCRRSMSVELIAEPDPGPAKLLLLPVPLIRRDPGVAARLDAAHSTCGLLPCGSSCECCCCC
jgi:hypothetical protein